MRKISFMKMLGFFFACIALVLMFCLLIVMGTSIFLFHLQNHTVTEGITRAAPSLVMIMSAGILLMYWQVIPFINKVISYEKELLDANKRLSESEIRLRAMAYKDALTALANRTYYEQFVEQSISLARRRQSDFALVLIDVDHFKNINDTIGHDAGDYLLQFVAKRLTGSVRETDLVARIGGDEFVVVVTGVKRSDDVAMIVKKIQESLREPITIQGREIYTTTSIGISMYPHDGNDLPSLMKHADLALYRAKEYGRNNYQFFTHEMTTHAQEKMMRQNALGYALAKNEFVLHYQPKIDLLRYQVTGIEALLRWNNKEYEQVSPAEIISLAEESGLIIPLSEWILKTSCTQLVQWQHLLRRYSFTVGVNLSPRLFRQINFVDMVTHAIKESELPAACLELEINENLLMKDPENNIRILEALKSLGVKIAVDDFGTGYSSLSYLRRFPIDRIKIDNTFVRQLQSDPAAGEIVTAIIAMANKLDVKTVAEGVETKEQYEFLYKEGCKEMQGYYICKPLVAEDMTRFLENPLEYSSLFKALQGKTAQT